jgi:hypothetical protein
VPPPGLPITQRPVKKNTRKITRFFCRENSLGRLCCGGMSSPDERGGNWTLLTGHGHVLVEIARSPGARLRDISAIVGLTERTVQAIVSDLSAEGYLTRTRTGRRTVYTVNRESFFRHNAQGGQRVGPFLAVLAASGDAAPSELAADAGVTATAPSPDQDRAEPETPVSGISRRSPATAGRELAADRRQIRDPGRRSSEAGQRP